MAADTRMAIRSHGYTPSSDPGSRIPTMTSATRMMGDTRVRRPITGARIIRVWWWAGAISVLTKIAHHLNKIYSGSVRKKITP